MITEKIKEAEKITDTSPTQAQKESNNYKKGKFIICGLKVTIENPKGSIRSGRDRDGKEWAVKMPCTYGYINSTIGKDGDHVDVYIGPDVDRIESVHIVDQIDPVSKCFDEHKVMIGFNDKESAKQMYLSSFEKDWKGFGNITTFSLSKFKSWLMNKNNLKYPANKMNIPTRLDLKNLASEKTNIIHLYGEVKEGETLDDLKKQAGDLSKTDILIIEIASAGGSVAEGLEIMAWMEKVSRSGIKVVTVVSANAYSIASLLMLVADVRLISKHAKVMVHNPMVPELTFANADELERNASELRELEAFMYELYELFTGLEVLKIKTLMDNETYLSPEEVIELNFADMVIDIPSKAYEMSLTKKPKLNMSKALNALNRVIALVGGLSVVNQMYRNTEGGEIEIKQADPASYKTGDRTDVKEGIVELSDGAILTIQDYVIQTIDRSAEKTKEELEAVSQEGDFNTGPAPKKEDEKPVAKVVVKGKIAPNTKVAKKSVSIQIKPVSQDGSVTEEKFEVINETFEVGEKLEFKNQVEGEIPKPVGMGEWELDDDTKILTDSDGVIRYVELPEIIDKKAEVVEEKEKIKVEVPAVVDKLEEVKTFDERLKVWEDKLNEAVEKIEVLSQRIDEGDKFQDVAVEAIDMIASNVTSNFKPEAKAKVAQAIGGSIFARARAKAVAIKQ